MIKALTIRPAPDVESWQPRARLFVEVHGGWSNVGYMHWVQDGAVAYKAARGMRPIEPITDQGDFTEFLRERG